MKEFIENLLSAAISSSVIILLVLIARTVFRNRLRPAAYTLLWGVVFLRLLLPIRMELQAQETTAAFSEIRRFPKTVISGEAMYERTISPTVVAPESVLGSAGVMPMESELLKPALSPYEIAAICYFSGAALLIIAYGIRNFIYMKRLDACPAGDAGELLAGCCDVMEIHQPKTLLVENAGGPGVAGLFHKRLLLDHTYFGMTRQAQRAILMHETAHIRCHHMELLLLSHLMCAAYWFNPLVWIAMRAFRTDLETVADYTALQRLSMTGADYAELLLMTAHPAARGKTAFLLSAAPDKRRLKKRIRAILSFDSAKKIMTAACLFIAVLAAAVGCAVGAQPGDEQVASNPAYEKLVSDRQELQFVTYSKARENLPSDILHVAEEQLGVSYAEICDFAYADLTGDGTDEVFLYYARGSEGMFTESGYGMAVIEPNMGDAGTVIEDFAIEYLYGFPRGQILPLGDSNGVKAVVLSAELGGSMDVMHYSVLLRENGGWRDIFAQYSSGYPYSVCMMDGPKAEVTWTELPFGTEKSEVLNAEVSIENGYTLGYIDLDGTLTVKGREQAENIETYGFDRMEAGLAGDTILLRGYQKITGYHKLDDVGELVTEWQYENGAWHVKGYTVASDYDLSDTPSGTLHQFFYRYFNYCAGSGDSENFWEVASLGSQTSVTIALQWAKYQQLALRLDPEWKGLGDLAELRVDTNEGGSKTYLTGNVGTERMDLDFEAILVQSGDGKWLVEELDFPKSKEYQEFKREFLALQKKDYLKSAYVPSRFYPFMHDFFEQNEISWPERLPYLKERGLSRYFSTYLSRYGKPEDEQLCRMMERYLWTEDISAENLTVLAETISARLNELESGEYTLPYVLIESLEERMQELSQTDPAAAAVDTALLLCLDAHGFLYDAPNLPGKTALPEAPESMKITSLFSDPHDDPLLLEMETDLDGDGYLEEIRLTDLHYNGGDGGYELQVFRVKGGQETEIKMPQSYNEEEGFPFHTRWTGTEMEIYAGDTCITVIKAERMKQLYEGKGLPDIYESAIGNETWEERGDAVSGFVLQKRDDGRTAIFTKSYLGGWGGHSDCIGYGVVEMLLGEDDRWDLTYYFMFDE